MRLTIFVILYFLLLIVLCFPILAEAITIPVFSPIRPVVERDETFEAISRCESNGVLTAKNKRSSASGEFQFIWGSWYHYGLEYWGDEFYEKNIWSEDNRELAWYVYKKYGTKPWESSKPCWSKIILARS